MLLTPELARLLDAEEDVTLLLELDGSIRYVNTAWTLHALRDGCPLARADILGVPYLDFLVGEAREATEGLMEEALTRTNTTVAAYREGECDTPFLRRYLLSLFSPLQGTQGPQGLVVRHHLRALGLQGKGHPEDLGRYCLEGLLRVCSCCRRVRDPKTDLWMQHRAVLKELPEKVSHGLCPLCFEVYYGALMR